MVIIDNIIDFINAHKLDYTFLNLYRCTTTHVSYRIYRFRPYMNMILTYNFDNDHINVLFYCVIIKDMSTHNIPGMIIYYSDPELYDKILHSLEMYDEVLHSLELVTPNQMIPN